MSYKRKYNTGGPLDYNAWKKQYNLTESSDYNLKRAWELGYIPNEEGHLPSVDSETGEFLKAKNHPTAWMEVLEGSLNPDLAKNKTIVQNEKGNLQYIDKLKYGGKMESKYRKLGLGKKYKFGDFLSDYGKTMLNTMATPIETISGRNFYDPEFENKGFETIDNIASGLQRVGTDIAGSIALGPAYGMGKQALQTGVNMADPEMKLDNTLTTPVSNRGIPSYKSYKAGGSLLTEYNSGGKHEENPMGGIPLGQKALVEEGETQNNAQEYIFSDSLFIDKQLADEFGFKNAEGKSFADYSKYINKKFPRDNDKIEKESKQAMLDRLTEAQESFKMVNFSNQYESILKKKLGGRIGYMEVNGAYMAEGGFTGDPVKKMSIMEFLNANPESTVEDYAKYYNDGGMSYKSGNVQDESSDGLLKYKPTLPSSEGYIPTAEVPEPGKQMMDINQNPIYDAMQLAPMVANAVSGLRHDTLDKRNYRMKGKVTPYALNIDPMLQDNRTTYANSLDAVKANTSGNAGAYLSNIGAINAGKYKSDAALRVGKYNADKQARMQADLANLDVEKYNSQMDFSVDDWNARSSEMSKNLLRQSATNLEQYGDMKSNEAFMEAYLNTVSDDYGVNFTRKWKGKYGGKLKKC
jgi:hypothetical protein